MARCNRQTISGGSFTSGGDSTYNSRNTVTTQMCLFHVNETQLQRLIVSSYSLGHGFQNQKLDCFKRWSGCEEVHALSLCVVAFLHLFRHQSATNFWRPLVPPLTSSTLDSSPFSHSSNVSPSTPIVITGSSFTAPSAFMSSSSHLLDLLDHLRLPDFPSSTLVVVSTPEIEYSRHSGFFGCDHLTLLTP